jgi:lipopolysaccharide/colanic/teichoic acid biosynthesis glycosyltransferase
MYKNYLKRIFDFIFALLLLPVFFVFYLIVAISIKIEDGGEILFPGIRLGINQKEFKMYKFRSMKMDAKDIRNSDGSTYNSKDDIRVTKVGKFIRELSVDEIPQILNILKGDMSFIGPRPSPTGNSHLYPKEYLRKFSVRPGLTGYTQVKFRNNCTLEQRQKSDLYYVDNISFLMDLKIIFMTICKVIKREDLYSENSNSNQ